MLFIQNLIEYPPNLEVQDLRCDHNMLKYLIGPLLTGIIPQLYVEKWGVIHDPIYQPSIWIHNHPIHYYYMDHRSKRVFSTIFQLLHCLLFKLNGIHEYPRFFFMDTTLIDPHQHPPKNIYLHVLSLVITLHGFLFPLPLLKNTIQQWIFHIK